MTMVWLVEKRIYYHYLDLGYEGVAIPIRVKFEFNVRDGALVRESLSTEHLYNCQALLNRYPSLKSERLEQDICETVKSRLHQYFIENGYQKEGAATDETI
jgi:hypothetical protein